MCLLMHFHQEGSFQDHNQENKSGEEELRCTCLWSFLMCSHLSRSAFLRPTCGNGSVVFQQSLSMKNLILNAHLPTLKLHILDMSHSTSLCCTGRSVISKCEPEQACRSEPIMGCCLAQNCSFYQLDCCIVLCRHAVLYRACCVV